MFKEFVKKKENSVVRTFKNPEDWVPENLRVSIDSEDQMSKDSRIQMKLPGSKIWKHRSKI